MSIFVDHAGLNTLISSSFDDTNTITSDANLAIAEVDDKERLAGINTHRGNQYGYSTWRQLRVSENPVTRNHKKNNKMTFVIQPGPVRNILTNGSLRVRDRYSTLYNYTEPAVTQKAYPLVWNVGRHFKDEDGNVDMENPQRFSIISSYGNSEIAFANEKVSRLHKFDPDEEQTEYVAIKDMYLENGLNKQDSPLTHWEFLQYRETVFPKAQRQYVDETRTRSVFESFFRHSRPLRTMNDEKNNLFQKGFNVSDSLLVRPHALSMSQWPLDEHQFFLTRSYEPASHTQNPVYSVTWLAHQECDGQPFGLKQVSASAFRGGEGSLMNTLTQYSSNIVDAVGNINLGGSAAALFGARKLDNNLGNAPLYTRRVSLNHSQSVSNPTGILIDSGSFVMEFQGGALWEAGSKRSLEPYATPIPKQPFYDTYEDYAAEIRRFGKNYTIIPEFRMTPQLSDYLKTDSSIELDMFDVTGGFAAQTEYKSNSKSDNSSMDNFYEIYSNTDFMRNFEVIADDHKDFTNGKVLSLRCKAIKKFLPYEGFYPCQRTFDIAERFFETVKMNAKLITLTGDELPVMDIGAEGKCSFALQGLLRPLFAPGVLFNTIKSGVAVDYPIHTKNVGIFSSATLNNHMIGDAFDQRVPFEALVEPAKYLSQIRISHAEPHPSGNLSASVDWDGGGSQPKLYSKMVNNFLAESINFFLPNGQLTSVVSKKQKDIVLKKDGVYGMRVKMRRSMHQPRGSVHYAGSPSDTWVPPQDVSEFTGSASLRESFTMYSRPSAFGPPSKGMTRFTPEATAGLNFAGAEFNNFKIVDRFNLSFLSGAANHTVEYTMDSENGYNFPFTPPYYHGEGWCQIYFTASSETMTIREIQEAATYEYTRFDSSFMQLKSTGGSFAHGPFGVDTAVATSQGPQSLYQDAINKNAVQLSSSLNIQGIGTINKRGSGGSGGSLVVDTGIGEESRWVIQTKFETPMLNFNHITMSHDPNSDYICTLPEYGHRSVPRGMWHQYGVIPDVAKGVFLDVGPIPKSYQRNVRGEENILDASEALGFSGQSTKLGKLAGSKEVFEAVVAVPFIEESGVRRFFKLDKEKVDTYKLGLTEENEEAYRKLTNGAPAGQIGRSVLKQMEKMKKYIFPPSFDFMNYSTDRVTPIAMYIFEFSHTLTQTDLQDIWQNLPPDIGQEMQVSEVAITHPLLRKELLGEGGEAGNSTIEMPDKLKWMVFKVKQRAASNYFKKTVLRNSLVNVDPESGDVVQDEFGETDPLQANWPYDFFSLVEMVKIDAEVEMGNIDFTTYTDNIPNWNAVQADREKIEIVVGGIEEGVNETGGADEDGIGVSINLENVGLVAVDDVGIGRFGLLSGGTANTVDGAALQGYGNDLGAKALMSLLSRGQWANTSTDVIEPFAIPISEGSFYNAWQNTWQRALDEFKAENPVGWTALEDQARRNPDGAGHIKTQLIQSVRSMVGQAINGMKQGDYYNAGGYSLSSTGGQNNWLLFVSNTFANAGLDYIAQMIIREFAVTL